LGVLASLFEERSKKGRSSNVTKSESRHLLMASTLV
jgi:hypothetical protein